MNLNDKTCALLISTYNWPEALRLVLESVKQQTRIPDEVIIADDGSGEATRELIREFQKDFPYPLIHVWHEDDGFRLAAIRNKAIAACTSDYIIQIDGDCVLSPFFVEDHLSIAEFGYFSCGGRVLVNAAYSKFVQEHTWENPGFFSQAICNRMNMLRVPFLSKLLARKIKKNHLYAAKGCNMAFWTKDLLAVNGYNESISGWGREDSEIEIRLRKLGVKRQILKFGGTLFHLFHKEADRSRDAKNIEILNQALASSEFWTPHGIEKE